MPKRPVQHGAGVRRYKEPGLPRVVGNVPGDRRCMTCGTEFLSEGWHNRLCRRCRTRSQPPGNYGPKGAPVARRGTSS